MKRRFSRTPLACLSALSLALAPAGAALANDDTAPDAAAHAAASDVVLPTLRGIIFVPNMDDVRDGGVSVEGIDTQAVELINNPAFHQIMQTHINAPLTLASMQALVDQVVIFAREHGHPVVDVVIPEQDIVSETIQVVVLEGRLGEVSVKGDRWFASNAYRNKIRLQSGDTIDSKKLDEDLAWINRNPFRQADVVFVEGDRPGTTDITVQVQERYPVRAYATYENSGNEVIGEDLFGVGVNWGNVFDTEHQAGYQYNRSGADGALQVHGLDYTIPLSWRHVVTVTGSYATVNSSLFDMFDLEGRSSRVSGRYWLPVKDLFESGIDGLEHSLQLGVDYKRSNNNLAFFGSEIFDDSSDVVQLAVEYSGSLADSYGLNTWRANLYNSPGSITGDNSDESFRTARAGAEASYTYVQAGYDRLQRLPLNMTWALGANMQYANSRLLASEQFGVGGRASVRGFDERFFSGDSGYTVTNELRSPSFALRGSTSAQPHELQLVGFVDWGKAIISEPLAGEDEERELSSVGAGIRYQLGNLLTVQADYGWQLTGKDLDPEGDGEFHMRAMFSY